MEHARQNFPTRAKLVGRAPAFLHAIAQLPTVGQASEAVLITGETGTGKELAARAIHYFGARAAFPFVTVNCGALPDTLLEDELFGHEAGAFTDARCPRPGLIAQAEKGTLFLDEIDALTPRAQVALLQVLQDQTFRPLGSTREIHADVRFLAASNASLRDLMRVGTFRVDLYYRLSVFSIHLPRLRERPEDILPLAEHFLEKHAGSTGAPPLSAAARRVLLTYDWPGNVRELENAIIRAAHVGRSDSIEVEDLGLPLSEQRRDVIGGRASFKELKLRVIQAFEVEYLTRLMAEHVGNISQAARSAGKERREIGKLLKKHRLDPRCFSCKGEPRTP